MRANYVATSAIATTAAYKLIKIIFIEGKRKKEIERVLHARGSDLHARVFFVQAQ